MIRKRMFPQPDFERKDWLNLNGTWEFSFEKPVYDRKIQVPYPWGTQLSEISENQKGTAYYRKKISWNPSKERVFLIFGAVDYECEVMINGCEVGTHRGGYDRFEFEVTGLWNRDAENTIEVKATDVSAPTQTVGKQGYGDIHGIWQTVWLEARPIAYIKSFFVKTQLNGQITYDIETCGATDGASLFFSEYDGVAQIKEDHAVLQFQVEAPQWWTPETPHLYFGELVLEDDQAQDRVSTYFGIREIGTGIFGKKKKRYITLNGKPYYINGVLDQSYNLKGFFTLPSDEDCRDEIMRLKDIGINMARIHIKAEEPLKLFYADQLGMLVMEDIPCFWGEPTLQACEQFEYEMERQIIRDRNHPSVFYWVIFNETWGLFTIQKGANGEDVKRYLPETVEWVKKCYWKAKQMDPTRLVEDNSPCNQDHTITDVNTWHFYANGYQNVKREIDRFCRNAFVGSSKNYRSGYTMEDVPCMNSECGNVWGVVGSAGESDVSWQYRYMMNEFRLHDTLCGFVFTEFHDVVNEFNGYYKIDNTAKDFGYSAFGAELKDLHAQDYVGMDYPLMATVIPGQSLWIPVFVSSFTDRYHGKKMTLAFEIILRDPVRGDRTTASYQYELVYSDYGVTELMNANFKVPEHDGIMEIRWTLSDGNERVMSNFILLDVTSVRSDVLSIEPTQFEAKGFILDIPAIQQSKRSGIGEGIYSTQIRLSDIPAYNGNSDLKLIFEASTRAAMPHDYPETEGEIKSDLEYVMMGYRKDPGINRNSFRQTDEAFYPGTIDVSVNGKVLQTVTLPDCPADTRGALSHHYQPVDHYLDEAGSYGYLVEVDIPKGLLSSNEDSFELTICASSASGVSLYGRRSGRYGIGIIVKTVDSNEV